MTWFEGSGALCVPVAFTTFGQSQYNAYHNVCPYATRDFPISTTYRASPMIMTSNSGLPGDLLSNLRILVLTLGEAPHAGWWNSQFLSSIGLSYLAHSYPRTNFAAAVSSATWAARAVHDNAIGLGAVFHLFRLPRQPEREIELALTVRGAELAAMYQPALGSRDGLLAQLEDLAAGVAAETSVGPLRLTGQGVALVSSMAAAYLQAFTNNQQVFPYFAG